MAFSRTLIALALACVFACLGSMASADKVAVVRVSTAKLRQTPSESRRALALLDRGARAKVIGRRGEWVRVELDSGARGWIREDLVRVATVRSRIPSVKSASGARSSHRPASSRIAAKPTSKKPGATKRVASKSPSLANKRQTSTPPKAAAIAAPSQSPSADSPGIEARGHVLESGVASANGAPDSIPAVEQDVLIVLPESEVALESEDRIARARTSLVDDALQVFRSENEPVRSTTRRTALVSRAKSLRGTPYRFGATGRGSFDCSGFTQHLYRRQGISIPRTAAEQFHHGVAVGRMSLRQGDLVFFRNTGGRRGISHVGMFLGNGKFIHASSRGRGVRIDGLSESYYSAHFSGARRMLK